MANDGTVKIGVNLDEQEFKSGLSRLGSTASGALSTVTKAAAAALAAATTAVGAFAKSAVETGMQFDATMSKVSAISGAVGGEFEALRDKAIEMGDSTKFSAIEAAEAMTYMGMAGWKAEDMMSGISGIMSLAAAAGEDLATTSDIVTDALTAFGMSASDSAHFADVLAVAATNANTDVGMMGETFKYMAPVAGAMGYSIEDSALAIGLMANSSIKASDAGTALRSIITRLGTNAGATKTQLGALEILTEKLGVEFYNTDGTARDLNSVLMEAREAWKGLGDEQAISYAKTIAGQYAMSGWLAIMNSSDEDVNKLTIALENANGAAEEMAAIMQDNLAGDITMFNSALSTAKITISDQLNPALREFVQFGTTAIRTLNAAFEAGGLSGAMETLGTILSDGIALIMEMLPVMVEAGRQLLGALGQGLLENLPLITDAVVQILMMIVEMLPEMIEAGMQLLEALDQGLLENLQLITDAAAQILLMLVEGILSVLPELATAAIQIVSQLASSISENLPELIPVAVSAILEIVEALIDNVDLLIDAAIEIIAALAEGLVNSLPVLIEKAPVIVAKLVEAIIENAPKMLTAALELVLALVGGIAENFPKIIESGRQLVEKVKEGLMQKVEDAKNWGKDLIKNFIDGILEKWNALKDIIFNIGSTISGFFSGIGSSSGSSSGGAARPRSVVSDAPVPMNAAIDNVEGEGLSLTASTLSRAAAIQAFESAMPAIVSQVSEATAQMAPAFAYSVSYAPASGGLISAAKGLEEALQDLISKTGDRDIVINLTAEMDGDVVTRKVVRRVNDMTVSSGKPVLIF